MWEHVGTNSCYVKLMFCLLVSYGSEKWVLRALQIAGADTPRNTTGHRRRAMDPNAQSFPRCFKDDSPNPSLLSGQDKIRRSIYCHVSVQFIALFPALNILSSPIEVELCIGVSSHPSVGNGQLTSVSGHRAITRRL